MSCKLTFLCKENVMAYQMSNVKCQMSNVNFQMSWLVKCQMSWHINVKCHCMSNVIACQMSWHIKLILSMSNVMAYQCQMSNTMAYQMSNVMAYQCKSCEISVDLVRSQLCCIISYVVQGVFSYASSSTLYPCQ